MGREDIAQAVDRMLETLIAEALLGGKIAASQTILLEAVDERMRIVGKDAP